MKKYIYLFLMFLLLASCNIALQTEDDVENPSIIPRKETISNMDEKVKSNLPLLEWAVNHLPAKLLQEFGKMCIRDRCFKCSSYSSVGYFM